MNTKYIRVIPRDLFNESKLLKCLGRLILLIDDNEAPEGLKFQHDDESFEIGLYDDGYLGIANVFFFINEIPVVFKSTYNSKSSYSLFCEFDYCEYLVFDEEGNFEPDFLEFVKNF